MRRYLAGVGTGLAVAAVAYVGQLVYANWYLNNYYQDMNNRWTRLTPEDQRLYR